MLDFGTHFQLHLEALRPEYKPSPHIKVHASEAGSCDRHLFYRLVRSLAEGFDDEPPSMTSAIAFHIGNNLHDEYQAMMKLLFKDFTGEVKWIYPDKHNPIVSGRCDGIYTDVDGKTIALEIKTTSKWSFLHHVNKIGLPDPHHALQAALSSVMLKTDLVQIVYLCKEFVSECEPIKIWTYGVSPRLVQDEIHRMTVLLAQAKQRGPVPPRRVRGELIDNPETHPECRFCPFQDHCIIEGPPYQSSPPRKRRSTA